MNRFTEFTKTTTTTTEFIDEFQHICIDFGFNNSFQSQRKFAIQNSYWKNKSLWKSFQVFRNELHSLNINICGKNLHFWENLSKNQWTQTSCWRNGWLGCVTFYSFNYHIFQCMQRFKKRYKNVRWVLSVLLIWCSTNL